MPTGLWEIHAYMPFAFRSEEHTSELQSRVDLVCRLLLEKKKFRLGQRARVRPRRRRGGDLTARRCYIGQEPADTTCRTTPSGAPPRATCALSPPRRTRLA